jgi:hypothetical protein
MKNSEADFAKVEFQAKEGDDFAFRDCQPASVATTRAGDFHPRPMGRSPIQPPSSSVDAHQFVKFCGDIADINGGSGHF